MALIKASNPDDEVFVIHFNDETYFDNPGGKDFLTKPEEMKEALGGPSRAAVRPCGMRSNWPSAG